MYCEIAPEACSEGYDCRYGAGVIMMNSVGWRIGLLCEHSTAGMVCECVITIDKEVVLARLSAMVNGISGRLC